MGPLAAIGAGAQLAYMPFKIALGASQYFKSTNALKRLQKTPWSKYDITPEQTRSYNRAEGMADTGYTGAEKSALNQNIASSQNRAFRNAMNIGGGNAARGISGALGASKLGAINQMGANDAGLRRQNMRYADQVGRGVTNQRNMQTQQDIAYRTELERTLGRARTQGVENIANAIGGQALISSAAGDGEINMDAFARFFGNGGNMQRNSYNQEAIQDGYTQPNNPYGGGFNLPPSGLYNFG